MATRALVNARALVDDGFRDDLAVLLDDGGDIAALVPASQARTQADEVDDLAGGWLAPGCNPLCFAPCLISPVSAPSALIWTTPCGLCCPP